MGSNGAQKSTFFSRAQRKVVPISALPRFLSCAHLLYVQLDIRRALSAFFSLSVAIAHHTCDVRTEEELLSWRRKS